MEKFFIPENPEMGALSRLYAAASQDDVNYCLKTILESGDVSSRVYGDVLRECLTGNSAKFIDNSSVSSLKKLVALADPDECLTILIECVSGRQRPYGTIQFAVGIFVHFLDHALQPAIQRLSENTDDDLVKEFVRILLSAPDRLAPVLHERSVGRELESRPFFTRVCRALDRFLISCRSNLEKGTSVSLHVAALITQRLVLSGQASIVAQTLFRPLISCSQSDPLWRRIGETLLRDMNHLSLEPLLKELLLICDGFSIRVLFGHESTSTHLKYTLCRRVFFNWILPPESEVTAFRNTFCLLYVMDWDQSTFRSVVLEIAQFWSKGTRQKYLAKHFENLLTKAVLIALGIRKACLKESASFDGELLRHVLKGVEIRLASEDVTTRWNGMIVGEFGTVLTIVSEATSRSSLSFSYPLNERNIELKRLVECDLVETDGISRPSWNSEKEDNSGNPETIVAVPETGAESIADNDRLDEIDSDDDLPAYEGADSQINPKLLLSRPRYLQDCYDGLVQQKDPQHRQVCLTALKDLITQHPETALHMCEDIACVLLGMTFDGTLKENVRDRNECLVALAVQHPKQIGPYLGRQVLGRNFAVGTRLEILQVVRHAIVELATGKCEILGKALQQPGSPLVTRNGLSGIARYFVYPLLGSAKEDEKNKLRIKLPMEDALVESHVIHTLSHAILYAKGLPDTPSLASRVFEHSWKFRYHENPAVRQAVLFSVKVVLDSVPLEHFGSERIKLTETVNEFFEESGAEGHEGCMELSKQIQSSLARSLNTYLQEEALSSSHQLTSQPVAPSISLEQITAFARKSGELSLTLHSRSS